MEENLITLLPEAFSRTAPSIIFFLIWFGTVLRNTKKLNKEILERADANDLVTIDIVKKHFKSDFFLETGIVSFVNGIIVLIDLHLLETGILFIILSIMFYQIGRLSLKRTINGSVQTLAYLVNPSLIAGQAGFLGSYSLKISESETYSWVIFFIFFVLCTIYFAYIARVIRRK